MNKFLLPTAYFALILCCATQVLSLPNAFAANALEYQSVVPANIYTGHEFEWTITVANNSVTTMTSVELDTSINPNSQQYKLNYWINDNFKCENAFDTVCEINDLGPGQKESIVLGIGAEQSGDVQFSLIVRASPHSFVDVATVQTRTIGPKYDRVTFQQGDTIAIEERVQEANGNLIPVLQFSATNTQDSTVIIDSLSLSLSGSISDGSAIERIVLISDYDASDLDPNSIDPIAEYEIQKNDESFKLQLAHPQRISYQETQDYLLAVEMVTVAVSGAGIIDSAKTYTFNNNAISSVLLVLLLSSLLIVSAPKIAVAVFFISAATSCGQNPPELSTVPLAGQSTLTKFKGNGTLSVELKRASVSAVIETNLAASSGLPISGPEIQF